MKINLPGDYLLEFTGNGIFYPDNSQTQQTGIRINELITYKDQDILDKKDLEFERVLKSVKLNLIRLKKQNKNSNTYFFKKKPEIDSGFLL